MQKITLIIRSICFVLFALIHVYFILLALKASTGKEIEAHYLLFKQPMRVEDRNELDRPFEYGNDFENIRQNFLTKGAVNKSCLRVYQSYIEETNEEKRYFSLVKEDASGHQYFSFKTFFEMTLYSLFAYHPLYPLPQNITYPKADCRTHVYGLTHGQWMVTMFFLFNSSLGYLSMYFTSLHPFITITYSLLLIDSWYSYRITNGPSKPWYAVDVVVFLLILGYLYTFRPQKKEKMTVKLKMFKCSGKMTKKCQNIEKKRQNSNRIQHQPQPLLQPPNIVYSPYTQNIYNAHDSRHHTQNRNCQQNPIPENCQPNLAGMPQTLMHL